MMVVLVCIDVLTKIQTVPKVFLQLHTKQGELQNTIQFIHSLNTFLDYKWSHLKSLISMKAIVNPRVHCCSKRLPD